MKIRLPIYTVMHFLVDLTCIYRLYTSVRPLCLSRESWLAMAVLYNFLAFALPGVIGLLADLTDRTDSLAVLGCIFTAIPAWFSFATIPVVVLQGIGNGLFHVGVGRRVLLESGGKYAPAGIFISSGALGVFLGRYFRMQYLFVLQYGLAVILLVYAAVVLLFGMVHGRKEKGGETDGFFWKGQGNSSDMEGGLGEESEQNSVLKQKQKERLFTIPVYLILLVVILRSCYGTAVSYEWNNTALISLLFTGCIVAGKALGGVAADRLGLQRASLISLGGAAVTVLFSENSPFLGCLSILLFNMTMPLTLSLLHVYWKTYPGFAFGILMLALFIGTLPNIVIPGLTLSVQALCAICLCSMVGLLTAIGKEGGCA
ncbi:MAG: hypothetical protein Q4B85_01535 [Lachnospiraceae bacterium]|nr:hypothetical protein [Lachnospiraceae bacterium]